MNQTKLLLAYLIALISLPTLAISPNYSLNVNYGTPIKEQNVDVNTIDLELSGNVFNLSKKGTIDWYVGLGQFYSLQQTAGAVAGGLGLNYKVTPKINFNVITQMKYLDEFTFDQGEVATKNFGGNFQFYIAVATSYQFSKNWQLGYRVSHMSNGGMYEQNPSLESHSLSIIYNFN